MIPINYTIAYLYFHLYLYLYSLFMVNVAKFFLSIESIKKRGICIYAEINLQLLITPNRKLWFRRKLTPTHGLKQKSLILCISEKSKYFTALSCMDLTNLPPYSVAIHIHYTFGVYICAFIYLISISPMFV